ncbi:MAG TPA: hypothetical protein DCY18_08600 [Thauera sp.]|nr:hypothetical protein [Thauera sp.]
MAMVLASGRVVDGGLSASGTIDAADETVEFTVPGADGDRAWISWHWARTGSGTSILTFQFKPGATWRDLYRSDGGINSIVLPNSTDSYLARCAMSYRFISKAADFADNSFAIEVS